MSDDEPYFARDVAVYLRGELQQTITGAHRLSDDVRICTVPETVRHPVTMAYEIARAMNFYAAAKRQPKDKRP